MTRGAALSADGALVLLPWAAELLRCLSADEVGMNIHRVAKLFDKQSRNLERCSIEKRLIK